ncbi:hypothetical protein ASPZODRAFT_131124 [Penicilliopsis zonata CBS 506.65]|uniref:Uncharacterized protein n=1 Tax=Penicilliopsis zonata CBS 506.65 TaxID=1073090 RepID=A0A1L9SK27_9EURO|nr:hypothetical protein ASPZODRAFT_131124 [Penicilliopsis zonata CBS 506.65]OJJ47589.1 hypothetical protein ASPZODRAFT_131124 [Penicilliopsis zonata CBS 506.65]
MRLKLSAVGASGGLWAGSAAAGPDKEDKQAAAAGSSWSLQPPVIHADRRRKQSVQQMKPLNNIFSGLFTLHSPSRQTLPTWYYGVELMAFFPPADKPPTSWRAGKLLLIP